MKLRLVAKLLAGLVVAPLASAASAPSTAEVRIDRAQLRQDESLTLQIRLRGDAADERPDFAPLTADFDVVAVAPVHRTTVVNGVRDSSVDWTLELRPRRAGTLEIPALRIGGSSTPPLSIEVDDAAREPAASSDREGGDPVFVEVEVSDPRPYEQQRVILRVRLWATSDVIDGSLDDLKLADAIVEGVGEERRSERTLGGVPYAVIERVYSLLPQESGDLEIPPLHFQGRLRERHPRRSRRSILDGLVPDDFFSLPGFAGSFDLLDAFAPSRRVDVASRPLVLDVRSRPAGAEGSPWLPAQSIELSEEWESDPPLLRAGEAANRRIVIRAKGAGAAQLPELVAPDVDGVKQYAEPPTIRANERGVVKSQDTTVIPTRAGAITLPAIEVAWWDTKADAARKAVIPARRIDVLAGRAEAGAASTAAGSGEASATPAAAAPASGEPPRTDAPERAPAPASARPWQSPLGALATIAAALATAALALVLARQWKRSGHRGPIRPLGSPERELRRACRRNDPTRAEAALRRLPPIPGRAASDLAQEVERLLAVRYSRGRESRPSWTGRSLWKAYRAAVRRPRERRAVPMLPPLYPGGGSVGGASLPHAG